HPDSEVEVRPRRLLIRNPNLVAYWSQGSFVVEDFQRRRRITAAPHVILLLAAFDRPRTIEDVPLEFPHYDARSVRKEARTLDRLGFLLPAARAPSPPP